MDPVTDVLVAFVVSESNNLELAKETLHMMEALRMRGAFMTGWFTMVRYTTEWFTMVQCMTELDRLRATIM